MKIESNMTMKMKLNPEICCIETQEKFWRGRLKEISDKFADEKQHMQQLLLQITAKNDQLKNELHNLRKKSQTCSTSVQTSMVITYETYTCTYCGRSAIENESGSMDINQENYAQQNIKDSKLPSNSSEIDSSSLHQQDHSSTVIIESASHNHEQEEPTNDVEKTITKLFRSNDQPESLKIADKLIELYEKRGKFIPEIENDEREHFQVASSISMAKKEESDQIETLDNCYVIPTESEEDSILIESTSYVADQVPKNEKINKRIIFPAVQNIRKKVLKNFSKIRRTCADLKVNNAKLKSCMSASSGNATPFEDQKIHDEASASHQSSINVINKNSTSENIPSPPKCQLISALKKSKSTGNIVKKVAFLDDLPTSKTVSESNLLEIDDCRLESTSELNSYLVSSVFVNHVKRSRPVPAPRSKKNIVISNI